MRQRREWFDLHDDTLAEPDVAVVGMPFDASASRQVGASQAPARLRELSRTSDPITRRGQPVEGLTLRDFGDLNTPAANNGSQPDYLAQAQTRLYNLPKSSFLLLIGGDNSISIAGIGAFMKRNGPDAGVIWFDAHPDLFEQYDGNPDSHACALRRAMTLSGLTAANAVMLGTRSFSREESRFIAESGIEMVSAADWLSSSTDAVFGRILRRLGDRSAIYLAVDIDGLDASCAPGTGYPMPGGVGSAAFFDLLDLLVERLPIKAMDPTEISPPLDTNDVTGFLGVQVILETLGGLSRSRLPA
ncbi:MAG: arginase family protein [Acidobacteriota bacterium]